MTEENTAITRREVEEILAEAGWRWQTRATPRTSLTTISLFPGTSTVPKARRNR